MYFIGQLVLLTLGYSQAVLISKLPLPGAYDDNFIGKGTATFLTPAEAARVRREQAGGILRTSYTTDKLPPDEGPRHRKEPGFYGPDKRNEFNGRDRNYNGIGDRNEYRGSDRNENGSGNRNDNRGDRNAYNSGERNGQTDRNENQGVRNGNRDGNRNEYRGDRNDFRGEDTHRFVGDRNGFRDEIYDSSERRFDNRGGDRNENRGNRDYNRGGDRNDRPGDRRGDPRNNYGNNDIPNENRRDYYPTHDPTTNTRKYEECGRRCGPTSYDGPPRDNPPRVVFIQPRPIQRPRPDGYQGAVLRDGPRPGGFQGNDQRRGPPNESDESRTPYRNSPPNGPVSDGFRGQSPHWEPRNSGSRSSEGGRDRGETGNWDNRRPNIYPRETGLIPVYDTPIGSFEQDRFPDESNSPGRRSQPGSGFNRDSLRSRECMDEQGRRDMSRPGCAGRWKTEPEESLTGEGTVGFYGRARRE